MKSEAAKRFACLIEVFCKESEESRDAERLELEDARVAPSRMLNRLLASSSRPNCCTSRTLPGADPLSLLALDFAAGPRFNWISLYVHILPSNYSVWMDSKGNSVRNVWKCLGTRGAGQQPIALCPASAA